MVKELNLSNALWQVLFVIGSAPLSMAQIARNLGLTRQSVRRSTNLLKERGLVDFKDNPDHMRAMLVTMTEQGRSVLERAKRIQIRWANLITQDLDLDELMTALRVIKTICGRLEDSKYTLE
jgi:DNA-binding MarR family transcriptional regulator